MSGAAPALLHHHGASVRATLPVYHVDCRFPPGSCFLSKSPILGPSTVSLACGASPNNHRPRNPDISRQQKRGSARGKSKPYQERDDTENNDEFDSDTAFSKNGPPISLTSNSRPQATSVPGEREKEIVELFKRVQTQLRARGKGREDKKPEPAKSQGERGSVDSLLNLLRKHSVDQRRKTSDEKEQSFDQTWRNNDSGNKQNSRIFGTKNDAQEVQKPPPATFQRPPSSFRRRSPVPGVKFQLVTNPDADAGAGAKSIVNGKADAVLKAKTPPVVEEETAPDGPDSSVPLYEPDSVIEEPEDASLDEFVVSDDESDPLDTDELLADEYVEHLEISDVTDSISSQDNGLESSPAEVSDLSSLKVTELRELAKSRGLRGYSKMKKSELVSVLSDTA
ncbi:SAP-like protein BP-73 [Lolium rigidum]|uniref:SAP-like protein BP-73 n=1 Tax=Lolium rigidum TaxID=89674 RepID=UPI001F5CAF21|nr:SAP-like protein BP-73 [Lolium rigidum]